MASLDRDHLRSLRALLLLVLAIAPLLACPVSRAADLDSDSDSDEPPPLTLFLNAGVTVQSATESSFILDTGTEVDSPSSHDDLSRYMELELNYRLASFFSIAPLFQGVSYNRADGTPNDKELSFFLVPRFQTGDTGFTLWAGCGVGSTLTILGQGSFSGSALNYNFDREAVGFALSPRVGMDYILDGFVLGLEATYTRTQASFAGTATDPVVGRTDPMTDQFTRNWWGLAARIGFQL